MSAEPETGLPRIIIVMGVSGSGKSTVAGLLAERLGWDFVDGDAFHSPDHVARMRDGHALDDADRAPWLAAMAAWIGIRLETGKPGVLACSALKRAYRDALIQGRAGIRIVYLDGDRDLIAARIARRTGHFMPAALLDSLRHARTAASGGGGAGGADRRQRGGHRGNDPGPIGFAA